MTCIAVNKSNFWTSTVCNICRTVLHTVRVLALTSTDLQSVGVWCPFCKISVVPEIRKSDTSLNTDEIYTFLVCWMSGPLSLLLLRGLVICRKVCIGNIRCTHLLSYERLLLFASHAVVHECFTWGPTNIGKCKWHRWRGCKHVGTTSHISSSMLAVRTRNPFLS